MTTRRSALLAQLTSVSSPISTTLARPAAPLPLPREVMDSTFGRLLLALPRPPRSCQRVGSMLTKRVTIAASTASELRPSAHTPWRSTHQRRCSPFRWRMMNSPIPAAPGPDGSARRAGRGDSSKAKAEAERRCSRRDRKRTRPLGDSPGAFHILREEGSDHGQARDGRTRR